MVAHGKRRVCETWSIGERKFRDNFLIRKQMFKSLVDPTITYGCEVFGYKAYEELERIQRRYFKWILGLGGYTKNDYVMEEAQLMPTHWTTASRAMRYEARSISSPCELLRECHRLIHSEEVNPYTEARQKFFNSLGYSSREINHKSRAGEPYHQELQDRYYGIHKQLISYRLRGSRYQEISTPWGLPLYLTRGHNIKLIARFRLVFRNA